MKNIKLDQILELLPENITLHYVDRNDSLDEHTEIIQSCISEGSLYELYEKVYEWFTDDMYNFDYTVKELKSDMRDAFEIDKYEAEDLYNEHEDEIRDAIYNRDDSDTLKDLFSNTNDFVMFYDTGHHVECAFPCNDEEYAEQLAEIKRVIKLDNNDYDNLINMMMYQAGYGGNLVIYFRESGLDVVRSIEDGCNVITFSGEVHIAIPNHSCGAGDHTSFKHKFSLPFDKANLFLCKEVKYSYTYDVCGMMSSWCERTNMELSKSEEDLGEAVISDSAAYVAREAKLDKLFKEGGCTAGDMKYERHRNTTYINEYPCGTRCNSCGTFFID